MNDQSLPSGESQETLVTVVSKLAEGQKREIDFKEKELAVRAQEIASNERIALASIQAQERSHKDGGNSYTKLVDHRNIFIVTVILLVMVFAGFLVAYGAKEVLMEIVKIVGSCAIGVFGGYQYGKNKGQDEES